MNAKKCVLHNSGKIGMNSYTAIIIVPILLVPTFVPVVQALFSMKINILVKVYESTGTQIKGTDSHETKESPDMISNFPNK